MRFNGKTMKATAVVPGLALIAGVGAVAAQASAGSADPCQRLRQDAAAFLTSDDRSAIHWIVMERLQARLGLTDPQADDVRATLVAQRDAARADALALCEVRADLRALMAQQDADPATVRVATDRLKTVQARLLDRLLDAYLALRTKLTPEQWTRLVELQDEMGPRFLRRLHRFAM